MIKLWKDLNLHSCVASEGFEKMCVALGQKCLCTTDLIQKSIKHKSAYFINRHSAINLNEYVDIEKNELATP